MQPTKPTLQSLQDQLALVQAQSDFNDSSYTANQKVELAQYNQRKHNFESSIAQLEAQITKLTPVTP